MVFQSTLPRGERLMPVHSVPGLDNFNPRSHEGSDTGEILEITITITISIHAPTRGATHFVHTLCFCSIYFNPRSHEGSDLTSTFQSITVQKFQSTLPRGERHGGEHVHATCSDISIHAPTRGATATLTNFFFYNQSIFC